MTRCPAHQEIAIFGTNNTRKDETIREGEGRYLSVLSKQNQWLQVSKDLNVQSRADGREQKVDWETPAQSLVGLGRLPRRMLRSAFRSGQKSTECVNVFHNMIREEQDKFSEYIFLYHLYSHPALIYEVQALLACVAFDLPESFAPLPRILPGPFENIPSIAHLLRGFFRMSKRDHSPDFRNVAISTSVNMLGIGSEAPLPLGLLRGYSCVDLSYIDILNSLLSSCCNLSSDKVTLISTNLIGVARRYGLTTHRYGDAGGATCENQGHLLQICVHRSCVNEMVYPCLAFGAPLIAVPPSILTAKPASSRCLGTDQSIPISASPTFSEARTFSPETKVDMRSAEYRDDSNTDSVSKKVPRVKTLSILFRLVRKRLRTQRTPFPPWVNRENRKYHMRRKQRPGIPLNFTAWLEQQPNAHGQARLFADPKVIFHNRFI